MWLTIIVWIISFLLTKKKTGSNATAALAATGIAGATYFATDAGNPASWVNTVGGQTPTADGTPTVTDGATGSTLGSLGTQLIKTTGETVQSLGPMGTAGVIGAIGATTGSGIFGSIPGWAWLAAGAFLLTR